MPLSLNHLSAGSFPVDQAAEAALVEDNPASRSEIRTGVLLLPGDDPAPAEELAAPEAREGQASEGGKVNIGVAKGADGEACKATLERNFLAAYDRRVGYREHTHVQESFHYPDAT